MNTTNTTKREIATRIIVTNFFMQCAAKGMTAEQAANEALKYAAELNSQVEGLAKKI